MTDPTTDIEPRVLGVLEGLGVPDEWLTIDPDFADTAQFCERYGQPPEHAASTIIVGSKREPKQSCACVVQAATRLDVNHAVRRLMALPWLILGSGSRSSKVRTSPEVFRRLPGAVVVPGLALEAPAR